VVLDEVQKVPELLDAVHLLIEENPERRFVLTGSSARKLRRGGVDLLAGRAIETSMHPFLAAELPNFELAAALDLGTIPLVRFAEQPQETLRSYLALYIRQEVQAEGLVRNLSAFSRFVEAISFSHGSLLNLNEVARECSVSRSTVEGYLSILEDLLLSYRLPVFSRRAKRQLIRHPKFYWFDSGVFSSARPRGPLDYPSEIHGAALEGLVFQHLQAWIAYRRRNESIWYWRTKSGTEVDFVVYGGKTFLAIEVKNADRIRSKDLRSLRSFTQDYPEARPILLYRGSDELLIDGIRCIPCEQYLLGINPSVQLP